MTKKAEKERYSASFHSQVVRRIDRDCRSCGWVQSVRSGLVLRIPKVPSLENLALADVSEAWSVSLIAQDRDVFAFGIAADRRCLLRILCIRSLSWG